MKKISCPKCGKELIRLEPFDEGTCEFWCDDCNIDITIKEHFECPYDGEECECRTDTDETVYWFCEECFTSFDSDGNEVYPEAEEIDEYEED